MTKIFIYPYDQTSKSARLLGEALNARRILKKDSRYRRQRNHTIINWGCSGNMHVTPDYNLPNAVSTATHKLRTFEKLRGEGIPCPEYTQSLRIAQEWSTTNKIVGRNYETARQGRGITVYPKDSDAIGQHLFYTKYFRKQREFRIHVFNGKVIFKSEKLRKRNVNVDPYIRSHTKGWILAFNHLEENPVPDCVLTAAVDAVNVLGLDFGAVDIGWNEIKGSCVFEVNTAPGIENTTLQAYVNAILEVTQT